MAKKRLPSVPAELKGRAANFFETIKVESDRGCVLVAAAFLDEALELLLRAQMSHDRAVVKNSVEPLFAGIGPLKSFWAKTELCRVLKLVSEQEYADLTSIRNLRNYFAHSYVDATFEDPKAAEIVVGLNHFGIRIFAVTDVEKKKGSYVRNRFSLAASWLAGSFHKRAGMTEHDA
jgi:DNA-binding MltR family transcriptional regulator